MTAQLALLTASEAPAAPGIDLRCCDVAEVLAEVRGAALVHADPPWTYDNPAVQGNASDNYALLTQEGIASHLSAAYACAAPDAYLLCWVTWPKLAKWLDASRGMPWRYVSGGAWIKEHAPPGGPGVGFHWRGVSEAVLLYVKGSPDPAAVVYNGRSSPRLAHSEKPSAWLSDLVGAFCPPGDLVLDLYAGLAPMARACLATGRRYVGAEIDPARHAAAMARLWRTGGAGEDG